MIKESTIPIVVIMATQEAKIIENFKIFSTLLRALNLTLIRFRAKRKKLTDTRALIIIIKFVVILIEM